MLRVKGPDDTMYTPIVRIEFAGCLLVEGRLADAQVLAAAVDRVYREHYAGSVALGAGLRTTAVLTALLGRYTEARRLTQETEDLFRHGAGGAMPPWRYNGMVLDTAWLDLAEGRPDEALRTLERFVPWPDNEIPPPRPDEIRRDTLAARAHLQRGDLAEALRLAQAAVDAVTNLAARGRQPSLEADAALVQGEVLLAAGQPDAARTPIEHALALHHEFDAPISPWLAEAETLHGRCLLLLGERAAAGEAATRARDILAANPTLASQFTQPLDDLQRALRT